MRQFKNASMLQLKGFEELAEQLIAAGKSVDIEGRKCFEQAAENLYDALYEKSVAAGLDNRLVEQIDEKFVESQSANIWRYEVGWKKTKPSTNNPLPDTYKVMFYNFGTPARKTAKGYNRGAESAHPVNSHGFIKKAKLAAANKNKKLYKDTLKRMLEGADG